MSVIEDRLQEMGIEPTSVHRAGNGTVACRRAGSFLFIGGTYPVDENDTICVCGKAGEDLDTDDVRRAGKYVASSVLSKIKDELGSLERVEYFVRCLGYINAAGSYADMPAAMNGFSDVLTAAFGLKGKHARAAVGTAELQSGAALTVNVIVKVQSPKGGYGTAPGGA